MDSDPLDYYMQNYRSQEESMDCITNVDDHFNIDKFSRSEALENELLQVALARSLSDTGEISLERRQEHESRLNERLIECCLEFKKRVNRINSLSLSCFFIMSWS